MSEGLQVSVLVYTLDYPERTERCMEFLNRQRGVQTDIRLLVDKASLRTMKKQFHQIPDRNIYTGQRHAMSKCISQVLQDCLYENVIFVSSDALLEEDTLKNLLISIGSADGLVFNYTIVRASLKSKTIYPTGVVCKDLFKQREVDLPDEEQSFSAGNIYESYPNIWNHLFRKSILKQHKILLDDFTRISQYLFIARYHSYCRTLAINTSLFVYKEHQGEKIIPDIGFCIRHSLETNSLVRRGYKRFMPETVRLLSNDFRVPLRQTGIAVKRKISE